MKNFSRIFIVLWFVATVHGAMAESDDVNIPQVSSQAAPTEKDSKEESLLMKNAHNDGGKKDYQKQILSSPMSDIGRADALTEGGGNTAVVVQQGNSNHSSIKQSGKDNYASQAQKGKANDISLDQQGDHNHSEEKQIGDYNHKIKIQNGNSEETTTTEPENKE